MIYIYNLIKETSRLCTLPWLFIYERTSLQERTKLSQVMLMKGEQCSFHSLSGLSLCWEIFFCLLIKTTSEASYILCIRVYLDLFTSFYSVIKKIYIILFASLKSMISCFLQMKTWAKAQNINSSKDKTLNSLSIILLVAFHLQVWAKFAFFLCCLLTLFLVLIYYGQHADYFESI